MEQKQKFNIRKKGGRPKKEAADKLKIPPHGEDGDIGLLHPERQGSERRHICRGIPARVYEKLSCKGTAHAGTYGLCPQAVRYGEQPEPACAQGECRRLRHGEDGVPRARGTYRGIAEPYPPMIAKIVKGSNFRGVVNYILDKEKDAKILVSDGLFSENKDTIVMSFEAQSGMNPRVTKPVGHIALAFSREDEHRLTDRTMAGIALEYLERMGIKDTQVLVVRHFDKEHPHVHIAFNRIANDGRTISDRNERIRSTRICKELTRKYGLYVSEGKEKVKLHRLKEPDKTRYELYFLLKSEVSRCGNWRQLAANLDKQGVEMQFKHKGKSDEVQGVVFSKNGYSFSGSKLDRQFSYSKIDKAMNANRQEERQRIMTGNQISEQPTLQSEVMGNDDLYSGSIGLLMPNTTNGQADENYFEGQLKRKKKKQRKISL